MLLHKYLNKIRIIPLLIVLVCLFCANVVSAQQTNERLIPENTTQLVDSQKVELIKTDSAKIKPNPDQLEAEVAYTASDSIVLLGNGTGFLYGKGDVTYKNINLKADYVRVKMDSSLIYARGVPDSLGVINGKPIFSEAEQQPYSAKELTYNLKSKKGYIREAVTQEGEAYIISDQTKKAEGDILCMAGGKYTTCSDTDNPHFYLSLSKAEVKPGSYIATGPAHMVLLDVPLPLIIPFGYFPFNTTYSSGIEMPNFVDEATYGYGLTGGGYYFALNDYMDMDVRGDIYTRGTWGLNINTKYLRRYKYNGNVNITYRETVTGEPDTKDYTKAKNFSIGWTHSQDPKVNPFRTLSASVNFSTSGYNVNNPSTLYSTQVAENTKSSSVSFSQRFPNNPFSLTGSMQINQTTKTATMDLVLPSLSIAMSRIYPFKRKNVIGKERWYEKISMSYSGNLSNGIYKVSESEILHSSLSKDWRNGMQHNIPVSATFNLFKYINVSASANYTERWSLSSIKKSWAWNENTKIGKEVIDTIYGFKRNYNFNAALNASTILYGFYTPVKAIFGDKIEKIRHVITPTIGVSYNPDFSDAVWGFWDSYVKKTYDSTNDQVINTIVPYSKFSQTMYGGPGQGRVGNLNFSLRNNLEMKVKNPKDTTSENATKIISLIDNFTISGGYNMMADSMKLSNFNVTLGFRWKWFTYSFNFNFDPYMWGLNSSGKPVRINKLRWDFGKFPRMVNSLGVPLSFTLNNDTFNKLFKRGKTENGKENGDGKDKNGDFNDENGGDGLNPPNENTAEGHEKAEKDKDGYEKVNIPWSLSLSYALSYGEDPSDFDYERMEYKRKLTGNIINANGNISLSPGWKISGNSGYDFKARQFTYTNFNIIRDLHCWTLSGGIVLVGPVVTYNFRIGVNASVLQDLKYENQGNSAYRQTNPTIWY